MFIVWRTGSVLEALLRLAFAVFIQKLRIAEGFSQDTRLFPPLLLYQALQPRLLNTRSQVMASTTELPYAFTMLSAPEDATPMERVSHLFLRHLFPALTI